MTLIDKLQTAILEQRWDLVIEAFVDMGGDMDAISTQPTEKPKAKRGRKPKAEQEKIHVRQEPEAEVTQEESEEGITTEARRKSIPQRLLTKKWKNNFVDDGKQAKADKKFDKLVWDGKEPTERRPPAKKINVNCDLCNKPYKVYAKDICPIVGDKNREGSGYKCDRCLGAK